MEICLSIIVLVFMAHTLHLLFVSQLGLSLFQIISLICLSWLLIQWQTSQYHMAASQEYKTQHHQNCLHFPASKLFTCIHHPFVHLLFNTYWQLTKHQGCRTNTEEPWPSGRMLSNWGKNLYSAVGSVMGQRMPESRCTWAVNILQRNKNILHLRGGRPRERAG